MVTFTARRSIKPDVVVPARATPREVRSLSDIDNHPVLQLYVTAIAFFRRVVPGGGPSPEQLEMSIKGALAETLVHYYPMAGRLRELPGGEKLVVDCTAEGAVFVHAHANVELEQFGKPLAAPYPCVEELMCDVGDIREVVGKPLLYLQMTHLRCGGLVLALTMCHSVTDGYGMIQILRCIVDLARGQALPAVLPVWERHIFISAAASSPEAEAEAEAEDAPTMETLSSLPTPDGDDMVICSFLFGPREIAALRSTLPVGFSSTMFELITAAVWRCRAAALQYAPHETVGLLFFVNARGSWKRDPPVPLGFYGNALFTATAVATVAELCGGPLECTIELVRKARRQFTDEHLNSQLQLLAKGIHIMEVPLDRSFLVSQVGHLGDKSLDLGSWAEYVGGGTPMAGDIVLMMTSFYTIYKDTNGDECFIVPIYLPKLAMGRFKSQITAMTNMFARSAM